MSAIRINKIQCLLLSHYMILSVILPSFAHGVCRFGDGSDCIFPCNCRNWTACDTESGACPNDCATGFPPGYDWRGEGCLVGNVAYRKIANQTGEFGSLAAGNAVDGVLPVVGTNANCAHPEADNNAPSEWTVDLGRLHRVEHVTLYNTYNHGGYFRMQQFELTLETEGSEPVLCGRYSGTVGQGANVTIPCSQGVGRYVHFKRYGGRDLHLVTLCEVVVWGHIHIDCGGCGGSPCNHVTGCETCPSGKRLPDCTQDCAVGTYGENCALTCGQCLNGTPCRASDGECVRGCQQYYVQPTCHLLIEKDNYSNEFIIVRDITDTSAILEWQQQVSIEEDEAPYYGYLIQYKMTTDSDWVDYEDTPHRIQTQNRNIQLSGLSYGTSYETRIRIYAVWEGDRRYGDWNYPTQSFDTSCIAPGKPVITYIEAIEAVDSGGKGLVTVTYQVPALVGCDSIKSLTVDYRRESDVGSWDSLDLSRTASNYNLSLSPGDYVFRISISNSANLPSTSTEHTVSVRALVTTPRTTTVIVPTPKGTESSTTDQPDNMTTIIVAVVVVAVVVVAIIVAVVFVLRGKGVIGKQKTRSNKQKLKASIQRMSDGATFGQENPVFSTETTVIAAAGLSEHSEENVYSNDAEPVDPDPVPLAELEAYVQRVRGSLLAQFKSLPQEDHSQCKMAETDENKLKNRFLNIHAYEHSRVRLDIIDDDPDSDYINANYINGFRSSKAYIATQGPRPNTFHDFWRLLWLVEANRLVMVTNLVENTKRKCDQYWPNAVGGTIDYGGYTVTMEAEDKYADYTIRILIVVYMGESRTVRQFHFTSWEDKKRPLYGAAPLLAFRRKVRSYDTSGTGPLVIHCSAGVGRTGTLIAIDILLQQAEAEQQIDIYGCVRNLRQDRMNMVQTKDQYVFLHDALVEALKAGDTSYPCARFQEHYDTICRTTQTNTPSELDRQFRVAISLKTRNTTKIKDGWKEPNKNKNRDADIVPDDGDRPYLSTKDSKGNNYINAVYVDSFTDHDSHIATQTPLPNTVTDFWRLVYDHNVRTVVMLDDMDVLDETCVSYWPQEDEPIQKHGPIQVELVNESPDENCENVMVRDISVSLSSEKKGADDDVRTVRQFQLLGWPKEEELPTRRGDLLSLLEILRNWQSQTRQYRKAKTVIHCRNGASRSGLMCALSYIIEKLRTDVEVDVFLAVRYVANRRPQFVDTLEQYRFLHEMSQEYMSLYEDYANLQ